MGNWWQVHHAQIPVNMFTGMPFTSLMLPTASLWNTFSLVDMYSRIMLSHQCATSASSILPHKVHEMSGLPSFESSQKSSCFSTIFMWWQRYWKQRNFPIVYLLSITLCFQTWQLHTYTHTHTHTHTHMHKCVQLQHVSCLQGHHLFFSKWKIMMLIMVRKQEVIVLDDIIYYI
jgi:hypothetical protein